jgi:hypothetical protein
MGSSPARPEATPGRGITINLVAAIAAWAGAVALGPWLPGVMGIEDLSGSSLLLTMSMCGILPSVPLGAVLGRVRLCWALGICAVVGPAIWCLELTFAADPSVHSSPSWAPVFFLGFLAFWLVDVPLLGAALVGWSSVLSARK